MNKGIYQISDAEKETIEHILNHGDRVELIPCKDSVKVIRICRNEVKAGVMNGNQTGKRAKND